MKTTFFEQWLTIAAPRPIVFELLSTPQGLCAWMAVEAEVELTPEGRISWTHENGARMQGRVVEVDAPRRLVFTYGWQDRRLGLGPEASRVELSLIARGQQTELHLIHRGLPLQGARRHEEGWRYFLARLSAVASAPSPA